MQALKPSDHCSVSNLDAFWLCILPQAQLVQLLGVGHAIVPNYRVRQGQDLTSVAGVSQGLGIPKAVEQQEKYKNMALLKS